MKKRFFAAVCGLVLLAFAFTAAACSEHVSGVSLNHETLTVEVGETAQLTVSPIPRGYSTEYDVTWSVIANPAGSITVEDGLVTAVAEGIAVVTATVITKFGAWDASCAVTAVRTVTFEFAETVSDTNIIETLNYLAPTGVSDGLAAQNGYFGLWNEEQIDAFNTVQSQIADTDNRILQAYAALDGENAGAVIVETFTRGYYGFNEPRPLILYIAIGADGNFLGVVSTFDYVLFEYTVEDFIFDMFGFNDAIFGNPPSVLTVDILAPFLTPTPYLISQTGATTPSPQYTGPAFIKAVSLAAEAFLLVN
ncbi:MAG: Ig-like domain-containing protein [Firmicutes bacterium]|nr:Ig-like domain-containing protein [Bacillota bacterium]